MPLRQRDQVQEVLHALTNSGPAGEVTLDGGSGAGGEPTRPRKVIILVLLDLVLPTVSEFFGSLKADSYGGPQLAQACSSSLAVD